MSRKISFDELVAKREQREADKLKVGMLAIPGSETALEARMPPKAAVLEIYGELAAAGDAQAALACGNHALYACCPQLQDRTLPVRPSAARRVGAGGGRGAHGHRGRAVLCVRTGHAGRSGSEVHGPASRRHRGSGP